MALVPRSLQIIAQTVVGRQFRLDSPRIPEKKTSIGFLLRHQGGNLRLTEIVVEQGRFVQAVSQQKIGEGNTTRSAGNRIALRPTAVESKGAAGDVRLGVVVKSLNKLAAKEHGVTSLDPGKVRGEGPLRVVIRDEALALRAGDGYVLWREAGCER